MQSSQEAAEERHQGLVELLAKNLAPSSADEPRVDDKLNALTGLKFDLQLPVLKDSDVDFARHWRNFKSIIDCHAYGRKGVRPLDMLTVLRKTLPTGSVRLRTYDTHVDRARRMGKLPDEAAKVFDELQVKLRRCIRETQDQKCFRLAEEFRQLSMGRTSHSEFHSKWEEVVEEMEAAGMSDDLGTTTLRREYLAKLTQELRDAVMSKELHLIDGPESPPRKPTTWQEIAEAVELVLENRADSRAPTVTGDHVRTLQGGRQGTPAGAGMTSVQGTRLCKYCNRSGHTSEMCPKKCAEMRGDSAKCLAESERTGRVCEVCGFGDHSDYHHRLAAADAHYIIQQEG